MNLLWTEQNRPECANLFNLVTKRKKHVSRNAISFWVKLVINCAYGSATDEDCWFVKVKTHEVKKISTPPSSEGTEQFSKY